MSCTFPCVSPFLFGCAPFSIIFCASFTVFPYYINYRLISDQPTLHFYGITIILTLWHYFALLLKEVQVLSPAFHFLALYRASCVHFKFISALSDGFEYIACILYSGVILLQKRGVLGLTRNCI